MQKKSARVALALSLVLSLTMLCACSQTFVGEEQAKKAGLLLLQQAFGVCAQDAHVEYFERAGSSAVDNTEVKPGTKTPDQIYIVTISDQTINEDLYYAEVDAKTGVAYYASKNEWLLAPLTKEQQQQTSEVNALPSGTDADEVIKSESSEDAACQRVKHCFQKEVALISAQGCCRRDGILSPRASIGYFVTFADGALYRVGFSWPSMELDEVQVLGNELEGANP